MAELTVQSLSRSGVVPTSQTLSASDTFANDGYTALRISNGHSSNCTVTAAITRTIDGVAPAGKSITVLASGTAYFGPFPIQDYSSTVTVKTSHQTSMTAEVIRLSPI